MTKTAEDFIKEYDENKKKKLESYCLAVRDFGGWVYAPVAYNYRNSTDSGVVWFTKEGVKNAAEHISRAFHDCLIKVENHNKIISLWENGQCIWSADEC